MYGIELKLKKKYKVINSLDSIWKLNGIEIKKKNQQWDFGGHSAS